MGLGNLRRLDTSLLLIQQRIRTGDISISKIAGADNPSDVLNKCGKIVSPETLGQHKHFP